VSANEIELLVERIERRLLEQGDKEIASRSLGERVLEELIALDPMAAVRFASVFQEFHSAEDYTRFFASLRRAGAGPEGTRHS
jgi:transcriptional repressor NrdR